MTSQLHHITRRVRMIAVLGYWVLGNIRRYWIVLLLGDIFRCCDTQYNTNQTAVSTVHMITILTSVVQPLSADDGREERGKVQAIQWSACVIDDRKERRHILLYVFRFRSIHCYATH